MKSNEFSFVGLLHFAVNTTGDWSYPTTAVGFCIFVLWIAATVVATT